MLESVFSMLAVILVSDLCCFLFCFSLGFLVEFIVLCCLFDVSLLLLLLLFVCLLSVSFFVFVFCCLVGCCYFVVLPACP